MMKIAIAQLNPVVGDIKANTEKIFNASLVARQHGADILLTPELILTGYPPEDLLLRSDFLSASRQAFLSLLDRIDDGLTVIVGHPQLIGSQCFNAASVIRNGKVIDSYQKMLLPNDTVFDEVRYFTPGAAPCVFPHITHTGRTYQVGIIICEDLWDIEPAAAAKDAGAEIILVLNASPYHLHKLQTREQIIRQRSEETALPIIYSNAVGGQDELIFDGQSFAIDAQQQLVMRLPAFKETLSYLTLQEDRLVAGEITPALSEEASAYQALVLGVQDYLQKNHFSGALLGLSGGIDSALTLAIACDAIGAENVHAVMMPSQYTADISVSDARDMINRLSVHYDEIAIKPIFDSFLQALAPLFGNKPHDSTEENLQARIRGTLLMALSNKTGYMVLTTGNKSEMATGYATLYGDMAGGFAVLKDVSKTWVYRLARYRNTLSEVIPERIITRPPSAELRPNQTDQDSLPDYAILDAIIAGYVEQNLSKAELIAQGLPEDEVNKVIKLLRINEYKRHQAPVGTRITTRAFGKDWRYPITNAFEK
jgi:NAD+ synthase (glutamine-hydrolysing)